MSQPKESSLCTPHDGLVAALRDAAAECADQNWRHRSLMQMAADVLAQPSERGATERHPTDTQSLSSATRLTEDELETMHSASQILAQSGDPDTRTIGSDLGVIVNKFPLSDGTCAGCNGSGTTQVYDTTRGPDGESHDVACEDCGGTGATVDRTTKP